MKLVYNLLWIDDDIKTVRGDIKTIENYFDERNLEVKIKPIEANASNEIISNSEFIKHTRSGELDFILIDFNMPLLKGSEVIEYIRKELEDYHTPIIFYTGDDPDELPEVINNKNKNIMNSAIDGLFYCHRDYIVDKFFKIVISKLNSDEKINPIRGMLMEKIGFIDNSITESIKYVKDQLPEKEKETISNFIKKKLESKKNSQIRLSEKINNFNYDEIFDFILSDLRNTDCSTRAEFLREILKRIDRFKSNGKILSTFYNKKDDMHCLNSIRNVYAHQDDKEIFDIHTPENINFIREQSRLHINNLQEILKEV